MYIPVFRITALPADTLMGWWPHTARFVPSLEDHKTPGVENTAGAWIYV